MSAIEVLRTALDRLDASLRAFDDPIVDEHPGLRLMGATLRERRDHVADMLAQAETCSLTLQLDGLPGTAAPPAATISALVDALQTSVTAAAARLPRGDGAGAASPEQLRDATALRLAKAGGDPFSVRLVGEDGPRDSRLHPPGSALPVLDRAAERLGDALVAAVDDTDIAPRLAALGAGARPALARLCGILADPAATLRLTLSLSSGETREALLDQPALEGLAAALAAVETERRELRVRGRVVAVDLVRRRVELARDTGGVLAGPAEPAALASAAAALDVPCVAQLEVRVTRSTIDGETTEEPRFIALELA